MNRNETGCRSSFIAHHSSFDSTAVIDKAESRNSVAGSSCFSLARLLLVATLVAAPWAYGAVLPWSWGGLGIIALVVLFLWTVGSARQGVVRVSWTPLYAIAALFLLLGIVQFSFRLTLDHLATREALLKLVTDLILFFVAGQLFSKAPRESRRRFALTVTLLGLALALFATLQFLSGGGVIYWKVKTGSYVIGPYVNHNHYAGLMEMLIPIAGAGFFIWPEGNPLRVLIGFSVVLAVASVLLSGSRGGLIALFVEAVIFGAIALYSARTRGRGPSMVMIPLGIMAAALFFFWMDPGQVSKRLSTLFQADLSPEVEAGFAQRRAAATDCLRVLENRPLLGAGLGSFEHAYPQYQSFASDLVWDHAHNDYAEALAETGLAGGILIVCAVGAFVKLVLRNLKQTLRHSAGWVRLGAALGCCGLVVHSLFDFNLHIPANAAWFAVCLGLSQREADPYHRLAQTFLFRSAQGIGVEDTAATVHR